MENVKTICEECGEILYSNIEGIIFNGNHKNLCSKKVIKRRAFNTGDMVTRINPNELTWKYGNRVFEVDDITKSSEGLFKIVDGQIDGCDINVHMISNFRKVE